MVSVTLDVPESTRDAIQKFAELTGVSKVVENALRVYEWVLAQQAEGMVIAALKPSDMTALDKSNMAEGDREILEMFILHDKIEEAQDFLWENAS